MRIERKIKPGLYYSATALGMALLFTGCGMSVKRVEPPEEFKKAVYEMLELEEERAQALNEIKKLDAQFPENERALVPLRQQVDQLKAQYDAIDKSDELAYDRVARMPVDKDSAAAQKAARDFIRDYPVSRRIYEAKKIVADAGAALAGIEKEKQRHDVEADVRERARQKLLDERFARRELSLSELKAYLQNKSQDEVVALLGQPGAGNALVWAYDGNFVTDATGQKRGINVYFTGGRVTSVGLR